MKSGHLHVIGVDGGGTKTNVLLLREDGVELGRASGSSTNIHSVPHPEVESALHGLIHDVCHQSELDPTEVDAICLGMSGCDSPGDRAVLQGFLLPLLGDNTRFAIVNDAIVAMRAVLGVLHGLLLIAGTGSICFGWNQRSGQTGRCGGWGHLLADEGSGYSIGIGGLKALLHEVDGRGPETVLRPRLMEHLNLSEPRGVLQVVYGPDGTKANIAALARFVMEADVEGDVAAGRILDEQARLLAELIAPTYRRLFTPDDGIIRLGLWGGNLVHLENYRNRFLAELDKLALPIEPVIAPEADAVLGAARHALGELKETPA